MKHIRKFLFDTHDISMYVAGASFLIIGIILGGVYGEHVSTNKDTSLVSFIDWLFTPGIFISLYLASVITIKIITVPVVREINKALSKLTDEYYDRQNEKKLKLQKKLFILMSYIPLLNTVWIIGMSLYTVVYLIYVLIFKLLELEENLISKKEEL